MKEKAREYTGFIPVCPIEPLHPEMLIGIPKHDKRLDKVTVEKESPFSTNTETWD